MIIAGLVMSKSSLLLAKASQAFFFFFYSAPLLYEDNFDAWLDDDGFKNNPTNDKSKGYLLDQLNQVKNEFKMFLDSNETMNLTVNNVGGARMVHQYINAYIIRIKKIRMIIDFNIYYNTSKNAYGTKYLIAKCCWINNKNGKVVKKFSKVVGVDEKVRIKGKVPTKIQEEISRELEKTMWNEYLKEYSSIPNSNKTI